MRPLLAALLFLAAAARPVSADDDGLHGQRALGGLTVEYWLAPGVYRPTAVELHLTGMDGAPASDVRRVDVQFAMEGMNHGARGAEAALVQPGVYQAAGYYLAMSGAWWMAVRVERVDGRLVSTRFPFVAPPEPTTGTSYALDGRPDDGVQVEDVAASPEGVIPDHIGTTAGHPVRVEVIYVDSPPCGPSVQLDDGSASADVSPDGLAELRFTPAADGVLRLACTPAGLSLRAGA